VNRWERGLAADFPQAPRRRTSAALNYPGTIKHSIFNKHQTDCWTPADGMFQVALVDLRAGSPTFGARNTLYVGSLRSVAGADSRLVWGTGTRYRERGRDAGV
jgi:dTDP-4-dehydrorhamnose 3,5-epimerase-like enzyme